MADLSQWDFAIDFTGEESALLIAGVDPALSGVASERVTPVLGRMKRSYELALGYYRDIYMADTSGLVPDLPDDALESLDMRRKVGQITNHVEEVRFAEWVLDDASDFERQRFSREQLAIWLFAIGLSSVYSFRPTVPTAKAVKAEKTLHTLERSTLLKLVIGMAIRGYGFDPNTTKSDAAKNIENDLIALGMPITDDTVRKYLKQAVDTVLPANWHQP